MIASSILVSCGSAVAGTGLIIIDSTWTFLGVLQVHFEEICNTFVGQRSVNITSNLSPCNSSELTASVV